MNQSFSRFQNPVPSDLKFILIVPVRLLKNNMQ